jgi:hypothetical protein
MIVSDAGRHRHRCSSIGVRVFVCLADRAWIEGRSLNFGVWQLAVAGIVAGAKLPAITARAGHFDSKSTLTWKLSDINRSKTDRHGMA